MKTPAKPARRSKPGSVDTMESLARRIAAVVVPQTVPDFASVLASDDAVSRLYDVLLTRVAECENCSLSDDGPMFDRIRRALPEKMRAELMTYDDLKNAQGVVFLQTGFQVGVMVGRRMAEGAR